MNILPSIMTITAIFLLLLIIWNSLSNDKKEILQAIANKECKIAPIDSSKLEDIILPVKKRETR